MAIKEMRQWMGVGSRDDRWGQRSKTGRNATVYGDRKDCMSRIAKLTSFEISALGSSVPSITRAPVTGDVTPFEWTKSSWWACASRRQSDHVCCRGF
jgi:hypothetical protein